MGDFSFSTLASLVPRIDDLRFTFEEAATFLRDVMGLHLTEEVLRQQSEPIRTFLLPLDDERRWYRYHHLFAEALRFRLSQTYADLLPTLHVRASMWFERHGLLPEAVDHAFAARDYERAATLIEPILYPMFNRGTHATVRRWLQALPEQVLYARPSLCLQYAWAFMYVGELASCERPLAAAERAWQAEGNTRGLRDAQRARDYTQRALTLLPEDDVVNRCNCAVYLGGSAFLLGEVREASRLLNEARTLCQTCHLYSTLYALNFLADAEIVQGRLHRAAAMSQEVMSHLNGRQSIHSSRAQSRLGSLHCEWSELELAEQHVRQGIALGEQAGQGIYMASIYLLAAQVLWVRGETEDALEILARAERAAQQLGDSRALEHVQAFQARLALARGDLAQAEAWSTGIEGIDSATLAYEHEIAYLVLARLHLARQRTDEAVALLERLHAADAAAGRTGNVISVLDRLLALAEPEGYIRVFVDEDAPMRDLLAAFPLTEPVANHEDADRRTTNASTLIEPLSAREVGLL